MIHIYYIIYIYTNNKLNIYSNYRNICLNIYMTYSITINHYYISISINYNIIIYIIHILILELCYNITL